MPPKRSEVLKVQEGIERTIYDFLAVHWAEAFLLDEIMEALERRNLFLPEDGYREKRRVTKTVLARLTTIERVKRYYYQGEDRYAIALG